jgi:hypothetical protein
VFVLVVSADVTWLASCRRHRHASHICSAQERYVGTYFLTILVFVSLFFFCFLLTFARKLILFPLHSLRSLQVQLAVFERLTAARYGCGRVDWTPSGSKAWKMYFVPRVCLMRGRSCHQSINHCINHCSITNAASFWKMYFVPRARSLMRGRSCNQSLCNQSCRFCFIF